MNHWPIYLAAAGLIAVLLAVRGGLKKRRDRLQRDAQRRLELVLQPKETVKVICPQRGGRCILTSKRLIFDDHSGVHAVELRKIPQCQGATELGKKTVTVSKMARLTLKAGQEYTICNTGPEFQELAAAVSRKVNKRTEPGKKSTAEKD